ncbi:hypothetical protein CKO25_17930 [Thiocapsa imhoffii]|uniref:Flagellar assembly protein T N-terminal domain-containing protein n=1 Tax=Thiocapsa imhoffii TaxID=382777 RepID=A0A9X1BB80_9GAMM|nr:hypothetical protein [Thiocapsa imhoffii]MBK1646490.1 hypothetical protein [Thiocapsa imhoffii]
MTRYTYIRFGLLLPTCLLLATGAIAQSAQPLTTAPVGATAPGAANVAPIPGEPSPVGASAEVAAPPAIQEVSILEDEMLGGIDWENNVVYAVGDGIAPPNAVSPAQARARAKRAAMDEAMAGLLEAVEAVRVDAESTTRDMINESRVVNTAVSGLIRNAEVVELRQAEDGSYQVKMRMPIHDRQGLSGMLLPMALSQVQKVRIQTRVVRTDGVLAPQTTTSTADPIAEGPLQDQPAVAAPTYTGLIIDASGKSIEEAMFPRILDPNGQVLYDLSSVDPNVAVTSGICAYRPSLDKAKQDPRAGSNPLIIAAAEAAGSGRSDLVLDDAAAAQIAALANSELLRDAKVVVVTE